MTSFDFESGVRVMCDVGYLCANFSLPTPLYSRLRPDVHDRQTSDVRQTDAHHRLMRPTLGAGHNNRTTGFTFHSAKLHVKLSFNNLLLRANL